MTENISCFNCFVKVLRPLMFSMLLSKLFHNFVGRNLKVLWPTPVLKIDICKSLCSVYHGCGHFNVNSWFALDLMAAMLEELNQKNLIYGYCIWSLFSSNMAAESLSCKSQDIDCKPRITPLCIADWSLSVGSILYNITWASEQEIIYYDVTCK